MSELRPPASPSTRPSKKRRLRLPPHEVIEVFESDEEEPDVIEVFDSDEEDSGPQPVEPPDYVFNTNDLLETRQTVRGRNWLADDDLYAWVFSREDYHSEQVDRDRLLLPGNLSDLSSSYVSPWYLI
jgi:hypothetical protein